MSEGTKTDITRIDTNATGLSYGVDGGFLTNHSKPGVGESITLSSVEFKNWPVYRGLWNLKCMYVTGRDAIGK